MEITCKHGDTTCTPDWLCEACTYDWAEAEGRQDVLDNFNRGTVGVLGAVPSFRNGSGTVTGRGGSNGPSEKQIAFIERLAKERGVEVPVAATKGAASKAIEALLATPVPAGGPVEGRWANRDGSWLVKLPVGIGSRGDTVTVRKSNGETQKVTLGVDYDDEGGYVFWNIDRTPRDSSVAYEPGFYKRSDGEIVKVQTTRDGERVYGRVLDRFEGTWDYIPGSLHDLTRLTLEEAKEYGHLYGRCCCCGRELTNEISIELGIGPICLAKNF